ncbi:hypothetical protein PBI_INGRID_19 [Arthrobacter phage Ingrid]|nr:hypothetical protein PBI_INGRID_19 [Arthrobacter phage Ingrid]QFG11001.1 hypothetical protein PBI_LORETTA_19 [Arthrobacter phage Loretta]
MAYKPVGVDESGKFPPRVQKALTDTFVTKPIGIQNGQVPIWDSTLKTWVGANSSSPTTIDGGVWDPTQQAWVADN